MIQISNGEVWFDGNNTNECIIRTFTAGVHIGEVASKSNGEVVLRNARRLWKWVGAFSLNEVATKGVDRENSKISCNVPEIIIPYIEIIPVSVGVDLSPTENEDVPL